MSVSFLFLQTKHIIKEKTFCNEFSVCQWSYRLQTADVYCWIVKRPRCVVRKNVENDARCRRSISAFFSFSWSLDLRKIFLLFYFGRGKMPLRIPRPNYFFFFFLRKEFHCWYFLADTNTKLCYRTNNPDLFFPDCQVCTQHES